MATTILKKKKKNMYTHTKGPWNRELMWLSRASQRGSKTPYGLSVLEREKLQMFVAPLNKQRPCLTFLRENSNL